MALKNIKVQNFKSFENIDVNLEKLNVLIGANASGKSNFIQIFKFLRDINKCGLDDAIFMHGGLKYIANVEMKPPDNLSIEITIDDKEDYITPIEIAPKNQRTLLQASAFETTYKLTLEIGSGRSSYKIIEDKLTQRCTFTREIYTDEDRLESKKNVGKGSLELLRDGKNIILSFQGPSDIDIGDCYILDMVGKLAPSMKLSSKQLIVENLITQFVGKSFRNWMQNIETYDFDPRLCKKAQQVTGKATLEEDGSNLALILRDILRDSKRRKRYNRLLRNILPFVDDIKHTKMADTVMLKLKEKYHKNEFFPSFLLSDGTINIAALIVALFFENAKLLVVEEPERNVHPHLIAKIMDLMIDASGKRQIILSTHNPEVIRSIDPSNVFLISRTKEGHSQITKPVDNEQIAMFLEDQLGLDELYVQNLLER